MDVMAAVHMQKILCGAREVRELYCLLATDNMTLYSIRT